MALTNKLSAIGNAIREKTGGTELLTLDQMPAEIANIQSGGGEVEPIVLSDNCNYACFGAIASAYIDKFGNTISTFNITNSDYMFDNYTLKKIPFALNYNNNNNFKSMNNLFYEAINLEEIPIMNNVYPGGLDNFFYSCKRLRNLPDNFGIDWNWNRIHTYTYASIRGMFRNCYSLRSIPESFLSNLWGIQTSPSYGIYYYGFMSCFVLDEIKGLKLNQSTIDRNCFNDAFTNCARVKDIIFALEEDGSVQTVNCKSQTIDLTTYVGYGDSSNLFTNYNSGITADKRVKDDATYQALKDDPDWFSTNINYSRYNHDSAVRTINSLPDTSAYLATAGGTNTIKFKGESGALTDGGAINTLTEEEIAVATAKGWTVSLV